MIPKAFSRSSTFSLLRRVGFRTFALNTFVGREATSCLKDVTAIGKRGFEGLRCAPIRIPYRRLSTESSEELSGRGIVVGCYHTKAEDGFELTETGRGVDEKTDGRLKQLLRVSGGAVKKGDSRLFYDLMNDNSHVVVVGLGPRSPSEDHLEDIDVGRQNLRSASAVGTKVLQKAGVKEVLLDDFSDPEACAEGSTLSLFSFDKLKSEKKRMKIPEIGLLSTDPTKTKAWSRGCTVAIAQNFARELMESPANHLTPTLFVEAVCSRLNDARQSVGEKLEVIPRPLSWIQSQDMGAFLSVAKGSVETPWLLEVRYNYGRQEKEEGEDPVLLVGKGVTFDTGGISIKPAANMGLMRGDMGGAACVAATMLAIAQLQLPISVVGLMPLCENMPSGTAVKPGDIVRAKNGKTIEVDNTDAEGRLILADALTYAHSFNPCSIIDLATLTGAMDVALGSGAAGVFTNSQALWEQLHEAGHYTGDRLWRMPLYEQYSKQIESRTADINNIGTRGRSAGSCTAAAFLKEFIDMPTWAHIDIAGVMESHGEVPFLNKGMSGRPTRTLVKFLDSCVKQVER